MKGPERFHVEQSRDAWESSWALLIPKLREARARAGAPRSFCMTCHRTITGYGAMTSHKVLGHDIDVDQARQSTKEITKWQRTPQK